MKRGKKLLENTIIIAIGNISTKIISFVLLPLYTTYLSTKDYGLYDLFLTIAIFLIPIITMLMEESMFRFLIDCKSDAEKKEVISISLNYIIKSFVVFTCIYFIFTQFINIPYRVVFLLYIFSSILLCIKNAYTRGLEKIKIYSISNFISSVLIIALNILLIVQYNMGIYGLFISYIISNIIVSIIVLMITKIGNFITFKNINKTKAKKMLKYSLPLVPNSLSWTIINLSDRIVVSYILGASSNGVYSMAYKFPNLMDTIYGFFYTSWKESAAKSIKDIDSSIYYNKVYDALKRFMWSIVLAVIIFLAFAFELLIKKKFQASYTYIPILMIAMYFSNISGYYGGIYSAHKDTKIMGITTIIGAIVNLVVDIFLIKYIGIWAAVISTLASTFIVYIVRKIKIKKYINLKENIPNYLLSILMLVVTLFIYYSNIQTIKIILSIFVVIFCIFINKEVISILLKRILKNNN